MPADHEDLLEELRRLRQRVERPALHPARHEVVARALRRRARQHRRLDLDEAGARSGTRAPGAPRRAAAAALLHRRPPQIEVAVLEAVGLAHLGRVVDRERRRARGVQDAEPRRRRSRSSRSGRSGFTVSAGRGRTRPAHRDDVLAAAVGRPRRAPPGWSRDRRRPARCPPGRARRGSTMPAVVAPAVDPAAHHDGRGPTSLSRSAPPRSVRRQAATEASSGELSTPSAM